VIIAKRALALATALLLAACSATPEPEVAPPPPPVVTPAPPPPVVTPTPPPSTPAGADALETGVSLDRPRVLVPEEAARALAAFRASCPALKRRVDASQLTKPGDWDALCAEAASLDPSFAPGFFYYRFDWARIGDGRAFATGYYEPEIEGSRTPLPGYAPVYRPPTDLVRCTQDNGKQGRLDPRTGRCGLYYHRSEIEDGALANRGLELAWAKDPVELFFVEIQGSGRIRFPDGSVMHIGYANQNGRDYVAIGKLLRDRGVFEPGKASMAAIKQWIRDNPEAGRALMRENGSYVFFQQLDGSGPLGALGVPVTPHGTVAADPYFVPLGAPVFLTLDRPGASGLWVAQDTGGAIKGANRFDTFWGAGPEAVAAAGDMAASGSALILLPKASTARAVARP
jgi:membrane-bound lytic murein transglycosylase A